MVEGPRAQAAEAAHPADEEGGRSGTGSSSSSDRATSGTTPGSMAPAVLEFLGTFFLVLVAAGGGILVGEGQIVLAAAVVAPGLMVMAIILPVRLAVCGCRFPIRSRSVLPALDQAHQPIDQLVGARHGHAARRPAPPGGAAGGARAAPSRRATGPGCRRPSELGV